MGKRSRWVGRKLPHAGAPARSSSPVASPEPVDDATLAAAGSTRRRRKGRGLAAAGAVVVLGVAALGVAAPLALGESPRPAPPSAQVEALRTAATAVARDVRATATATAAMRTGSPLTDGSPVWSPSSQEAAGDTQIASSLGPPARQKPDDVWMSADAPRTTSPPSPLRRWYDEVRGR